MKIFITGASGFGGRHLIRILEAEGHAVFGTTFPEKPQDIMEKLPAELYHVDIRDGDALESCISKVRPDRIFHLAAVSNVRHSWENRRNALDINIIGTFNLLEAVKKNVPQARVLFMSSADVYGISPDRKEPAKETDGVFPINPYAATKISGETLCRFYIEADDLDIIIVRAFPHTGPGQSKDFVCSDWAFQISRIEKEDLEPVIRVGNISVERECLDVRDVVQAYSLLMEKGVKGEIYNVCSEKAVALRKILHILLSLSPKSVEIKVDEKKLRKADIPVLVGDGSKMRRAIGWQPAIPLNQTLLDLLEYWRSC